MTPQPSTRWRRRKEARPDEILAAALASFAERGFAATRLEDVAARAGVSKGTLYLYLVYGMHWMLNVVTGPVDYPAAVLVRAVQGINGPARLTKAMGVTGSLNGKLADEDNSVWFSEGTRPLRNEIIRSARIGVDYAGPIWSIKPLRFNLNRNA